MNDVRVVAVLRCECGEQGHARALLRPAAGGRGIRVRVNDRTARALVAELNDAACAEAPLIDLLASTLQAAGCTLTGVTLMRDDDDAALGALLRLDTAGEERTAPAVIDTALLVACRLRLPIRVERKTTPPTELPTSVAAFLRGLDLSALDRPDGGRSSPSLGDDR